MGQRSVLCLSIPFKKRCLWYEQNPLNKIYRRMFLFRMSLIILRALAVDAAFVPLRGKHCALTGQHCAQLSCVLWVYPDNAQTDYSEQWQNYWDNGAPWVSVGVWIGLWHFLIWFCRDCVGVWQRRSKGLQRHDVFVDNDPEQSFFILFLLHWQMLLLPTTTTGRKQFVTNSLSVRVDSAMLCKHFIRHVLNVHLHFIITHKMNWRRIITGSYVLFRNIIVAEVLSKRKYNAPISANYYILFSLVSFLFVIKSIFHLWLEI